MNKPDKSIGGSVIRVDLSEGMDKALKRAKDVLLSGGLVAYPTESFYGFGADATNDRAIQRLFLAKKRKPDRPLLILIPTADSLARYVNSVPPVARRLIGKFWPGGLTLIFEASPEISPLLTAGTGKIGIRLSSHPVATALARAIGKPITGTSANISGEPACPSAGEVLSSLQEKVDLVLDGGKTPGETGSTILDVTTDPPRILREGMVPLSEFEGLVAFAQTNDVTP